MFGSTRSAIARAVTKVVNHVKRWPKTASEWWSREKHIAAVAQPNRRSDDGKDRCIMLSNLSKRSFIRYTTDEWCNPEREGRKPMDGCGHVPERAHRGGRGGVGWPKGCREPQARPECGPLSKGTQSESSLQARKPTPREPVNGPPPVVEHTPWRGCC